MVYSGPVKSPGCCPVVSVSTAPAPRRSRAGPGTTAARTSAAMGRGLASRGDTGGPASGVATMRGITRAPFRWSFSEHVRLEGENLGAGLPPRLGGEARLVARRVEQLLGRPTVFRRDLR